MKKTFCIYKGFLSQLRQQSRLWTKHCTTYSSQNLNQNINYSTTAGGGYEAFAAGITLKDNLILVEKLIVS